MKGHWFYYGVAAFLGVLFALEKKMYLLVCFVALFIFLWRKRKFLIKNLFMILMVFFIFFIKADINNYLNKTALTGKETKFPLLFDQPLKIDGNQFTAYATIETSGERLAVQYRIQTLQEKQEWLRLNVGSKCHVRGELEEPQLPRNANAFNYQHYLRYEGIHWILKVSEIKVTACKKETTPLTILQNIREKGIQYIETYFPQETAPLAIALIFGDRNTIAPDLLTAYQRLGIVHLLAISGLHVGMLIGLIFYIGLRFQISREMMMNLLLLFLPIYMILTGGSPSVIRACFMVLLALILTKRNRHKLIPIDILSIVFVSYIFIQPYVIYNIGFQLSFSVTFSLILSAPILSRFIHKPIYLLVITSITAQIASTPILLYHFYEISITSIFMNIFYIPLFSIVVLPVLLLLLFLHLTLGNIVNPLLSFIDFNLNILNDTTVLLSHFSFNTIVLGRPPALFLLLYVIAIPFFFFRWELARSKKEIFIAFLVPLGLISSHYIWNIVNVEGEVTLIDVGQGDSILINLPFGRGTYLIDTGGTMGFPTEEWERRKDPFEVGKDVLVPYLKSVGINKIDKLILTHGDTDHVGGAFALLDAITVKEVVLPKIEEPSSLEKEIIKLCKEKRIPLHLGRKGDSWKAGSASFTILAPLSINALERNDQSIILYSEMAGLKWLFTGDMEEEGEKKLVSAYPSLKIDVLKVGHHGSKTSTSEEFLSQINPEVALISAGENNRFGHPHKEVLGRLENEQVRIFQTNQDGAITFSFQGNKVGTFSTQFHTIKKKPK